MGLLDRVRYRVKCRSGPRYSNELYSTRSSRTWVKALLDPTRLVFVEFLHGRDFGVPQQSALVESELSQRLVREMVAGRSSHNVASILEEINSQLSRVVRGTLPLILLSQSIDRKAFKKPMERGWPIVLHKLMASPLTS